jgi:uncharacterized protein (DUF2237 family)
MNKPRNVFGDPLQLCSTSPLTGFTRDGACQTGAEDQGNHTVCAQVTEDYLAYSKQMGNDLSTPVPAYGFPGLQAGDRWCVCAARWLEAAEAGCAPPVVMEATHERALKVISLGDLQYHALQKTE